MSSAVRRALWMAVGVAIVGWGSAGCRTVDPAGVEDARIEVTRAKEDPRIEQDRSVHLQEAVRHLALAEERLANKDHQTAIDHQAYLAATHAKVAQVEAQARTAEKAAAEGLQQARRDTAGTQRVVEAAVRRAEALDAQRTVRGLVLTLGGVLFGFDSAELKPDAELAIARVAGFLIALTDREVLVEGYTDNTGEFDYNVDLSARRAEAVRDALVRQGVESGRVVARGYGPAFPLEANDSEEGRRKNRRVEIVILDDGEKAADVTRM